MATRQELLSIESEMNLSLSLSQNEWKNFILILRSIRWRYSCILGIFTYGEWVSLSTCMNMGSYSKVSKSTYVYLGHAWTLSKKRDTQVFNKHCLCTLQCSIIVIYCNIIVIHSELYTSVYAPISNHFISQTESRHTGVEDSGSCRYIQQQNAAYWNLQSVESIWSYDLTWLGSIDYSKIEMVVLFLLYLTFQYWFLRWTYFLLGLGATVVLVAQSTVATVDKEFLCWWV